MDLEILKSSLSDNNVEMVLKILQKVVAGYRPDGEVVDWYLARKMCQSTVANDL